MLRNKRLPAGVLTYLITRGEARSSNFSIKKAEILETVRRAVDSKIKLIQIREKQLPAKLLFDLAFEASANTRGTGTKILINGRADIALAANADGVHLPADSLPADVTRLTFPKELIIGVSAHSHAEAEFAETKGADFVCFGPVFESPEKGEPKGLDELQRICKILDGFPVIALGGINETNYKSVLDRGAAGFAAIRFLNDPDSLRRLSEDLTDE